MKREAEEDWAVKGVSTCVGIRARTAVRMVVLNGHTRRRASKFFPTRAAAAAERAKLQVKLDLAKEHVLRRTPKGSAVNRQAPK